jgi:hypothetical protein
MAELKDWTEPDLKGNIDVPDELMPLFNKIGMQIRFHTISGANEVLTIARMVKVAQEFFEGRALAKTSNDASALPIPDVVCSTCKHWGGQGTIGLAKTTTGDNRTCMAYLFGDMDNENFKSMPNWKVTFGNLNVAKGVLETHKDFVCVNHNSVFEE